MSLNPSTQRSPVPARHLLALLLILTLLLSACGAAATPSPEMSQSYERPPAQPRESAGGVAPAFEQDAYTANTAAQAAERLIIRNASLTIIVADPTASLENIQRLADELGGFVVSSSLQQVDMGDGNQVPRGSVTLRVPAERLDEALTRIHAETDRPVEDERVESQDVTAEYTDLQSRLRNLESTEAQLVKIQEQARTTEDVLSVYDKLVSIREQIEVLKGQIQYYERSAALSSITVQLIANEAVQPLQIGTWQPQGVAKNAVQALLSTMKGIANAAIWVIIYVLPVVAILFLIFVLPFILIVRAVRRRRTPKAKPPQPQEAA